MHFLYDRIVVVLIYYYWISCTYAAGGIDPAGSHQVRAGSTTTTNPSNQYNPHLHDRQLQETSTNYVADYKGRFHYQRHPACTGNFPELQATCRGTIELQNVSHPEFISCGAIKENTADQTSSIVCNTTCSVSDCLNVFLGIDLNLFDGPYGEITFRCSGEDIYQAQGSFSYLETGLGTCSNFSGTRTWNAHVAQLGVLCQDEYVYDDYFFNCNRDSFPLVPNNAEPVSNNFACLVGKNCRGVECNIIFYDMVISAEIQHFQDHCVSSPNVLALTSSPTPPPVERASGTLQIVGKFKFVFGSDSSPFCTINRPVVTIKCTNGQISFIESTLGLNPCDVLDDQTLLCKTGPATLSLGPSQNITYSCTSYGSPLTIATLNETQASCSSTRQYGSLGVYCSDLKTPDFAYIDRFFECGEQNTLFGILSPGNRYTCYSSSSATSGSTIPGLSVGTGTRYKADPFSAGCAKTPAPEKGTTVAPAPAAMVQNNEKKDNGPNILIIVVAVVGGLVVVVLLGILLVIYNKQKCDDDDGPMKKSKKELSYDPSQTDLRETGIADHSNFGPAPWAYDYDASVAPVPMPQNGHNAVQVANVLCVDGPIADLEPLPNFYFPRADALQGQNSIPDTSRFKDQASDEPPSYAGQSGQSSHTGQSSKLAGRSTNPPFLQQKIDQISQGRVPEGASAKNRAHGVDADNSRYKDEAQSVVGEVQAVNGLPYIHPSRQETGVDADNSRYKDEAQSVIGEVQTVNGLPYVYPSDLAAPKGSVSQTNKVQGDDFLDQSMLPIKDQNGGAMAPNSGQSDTFDRDATTDPNDKKLNFLAI